MSTNEQMWAGYALLARGFGDLEVDNEDHYEVPKLALELHAQDHDEDGVGVDECDIDWHTDSWFRHRAATILNSGRGGR